jgi:GTPase SAR1 family protein
MESQELEYDKNLIHFIKMNIFGDSGVGKSTFISFLEDFKNENFEIMNKSNSSFDDSIEISENLVEQIKKIEVPIYDDRNIHFLIYETNLNYFDTIKANLDTLLVQTECIIIMWDSSNSNTFQNIPNFIKSIISMIKENKLGNINNI